jgi:hypothetical protein
LADLPVFTGRQRVGRDTILNFDLLFFDKLGVWRAFGVAIPWLFPVCIYTGGVFPI